MEPRCPPGPRKLHRLRAGAYSGRQLPPDQRLPESTVRHAFALYQLPSMEEGFADVKSVPANADWSQSPTPENIFTSPFLK